MQYIVHADVVLSRAPVGPLAVHLGPFATSLKQQGYARASIHRKVLLAACFSQWLKHERVALRDVTSDHPAQHLRDRVRQVEPRPGDTAALRDVLEFLRGEGVLTVQTRPAARLLPVERCVRAFEHYLRDARALAPATIINYGPFIREFLADRFGTGPVRLSRLRARDVVGHVQRQAPRLHRKRAQLLTCALRAFLRYARHRGAVDLDLAAAVPTVANWSMPAIPRAIGADQVRRLLASFDRRTATGRRDYAVVLLLARLGLRASEVVWLELDDIDWTAGRVSVHGKRGRRSQLPLPVDVGHALVAYLRRGRPPTSSRRVFLRTKAPIRGFRGPSAIGSIIRHALHRTGIEAPTTGAHQFRHGLATEMLRQGASLQEISELLGHRHPQTTTIYAKVDLTALRTLALPWPGGVQ